MNINAHEEHNLRYQERWMDTSIQMESPFTQRYEDKTVAISLFDKIVSNSKFDPYEIIGVPKDCVNIKQVQKCYKKRLVKHHPDKNNGETLKFDVIKHAYSIVLSEVKNRMTLIQSKTDIELRQQSESFIQNQPQVRHVNLDTFDAKKFNKLYEQNRIPNDQIDGGYGKWMKKDKGGECPSKIKEKDFKHVFESHKEKVMKTKRTAIVVHKDPEAYSQAKLSIGYCDIDPKRKKHFSTDKGTDLKHAYSEKYSLIDTGEAEKEIHIKMSDTITKRKKRRTKEIKPEMDQKLKIRLINKQRMDAKKEEKRKKRILLNDKRIEKQYKKINRLMIEKS